MKIFRVGSWCLILLLGLASLLADHIAPAHYATQFRQAPDAPPSHRFLLGTDDLGRDRFSRLLFGGRISLFLAPIAAALSVLLAAIIGTVAGYVGGAWERGILAIIDLFLSLPWLFLLITVRAALPLNVSPIVSVTVTFLLLGLLGWAASARVICSGVNAIKNSNFMIGARASGSSPVRAVIIHLIPNLKGTLWAQFVIAIPVYILTEANLTILGLGVAEPLPSWGSLLRDLNVYAGDTTHVWQLAPLFLLMAVVWAFQIASTSDEVLT